MTPITQLIYASLTFSYGRVCAWRDAYDSIFVININIDQQACLNLFI